MSNRSAHQEFNVWSWVFMPDGWSLKLLRNEVSARKSFGWREQTKIIPFGKHGEGHAQASFFIFWQVDEEDEEEEEEIDWWSKYYATMGDLSKSGHYLEKGYDSIKVCF